MATGPTTLNKEMEEMMFEGCRLVNDLKLADDHIDVLEKESKKLKEVINDLNCESAVFKAERDQADERVMKLEEELKEKDLTIENLKKQLQEWEDFEGWRQGRWVLVQQELKKLREENASLKHLEVVGTSNGC